MAMFKAAADLLHLSKSSTVASRTLSFCFQNLNYFCCNRNVQISISSSNNINHGNNFRKFSTSPKFCDNYEGDGKTTMTSLNREYKHLVMIDTYSSVGFRLNNGVYAIGPIAVFPRTILHWNVKNVEELTIGSVSLFCLLDPKIDIFILGSGDCRRMPEKEILDTLKSCKISVEVLSTDKAISLFNFLNAEGRCVAGAFIPPTSVTAYGEEIKLLDIPDTLHRHPLPPDPKIDY